MSRPRIVIVGAGFAGYRTARTLERLSRGKADITLLNPTDYFLYLPLLPQVAAGILEPRRVTVSLTGFASTWCTPGCRPRNVCSAGAKLPRQSPVTSRTTCFMTSPRAPQGEWQRRRAWKA